MCVCTYIYSDKEENINFLTCAPKMAYQGWYAEESVVHN
jgi:hypothetical protein